jgi:hypothetical protein
VPALETERARAMRWGVADSEEFCSRALSQCLRKDGTRCLDLPGDSVGRHWDERRVRRQSKGLRRVQGRIAMEERAPQRSTERGTRFSAGAGGHKVKLREGSESRMCLGKGVVAMRRRGKE